MSRSLGTQRTRRSGRDAALSSIVPGWRARGSESRSAGPTTEQVELARWYLEERPVDLDELDFTRRIYGHDYTFNDGKQLGNERHAQELLNMWQWQRGKSDDELIEEIEIQVITLGNVAIVAFPVELFSNFGRRVKPDHPSLTHSSLPWPTAGTVMHRLWRLFPAAVTDHASPTLAGSLRRRATA